MSNRPRRKGNRKTPARSQVPARTNRPGPQQGEATANLEYQATRISFEGPLPPPQVLEEYDRIVPGLSATMVKEYSAQGAHRRQLEAAVIGANIRAQDRGQWISAGLFLAMLVAAVVLGLSGATAVALAIAAIDVLGFGGIYVFGRWSQERERDEKAELTKE